MLKNLTKIVLLTLGIGKIKYYELFSVHHRSLPSGSFARKETVMHKNCTQCDDENETSPVSNNITPKICNDGKFLCTTFLLLMFMGICR